MLWDNNVSAQSIRELSVVEKLVDAREKEHTTQDHAAGNG
jgi:hypothetical protein